MCLTLDHRRLMTLTAVAAISMLVASPVTAKKKKKKKSSSKISAELRTELEPSINELKSDEDAQARQAALLSWGLIIDKKTMPELEALKTSEDAEVRLGAGLAMMLAKKKKSEEFVISELGTQGELYMKLRDRISVLDDGVEWTLLDALLDKKDAATTRDVMRYLTTQDNDLFERLVKIATAKKDSEQRVAALEALVAASAQRADLLDEARTLVKKKDLAQRQAAVSMFDQLLGHTSTRADALEALSRVSDSDKDEALKLVAFKHMLASGDVSILPKALGTAATTDDAALRTLIINTAHNALESGYKPSYKDLEALVKLDKLTGSDQVKVFQLAARSGDEKFSEKLLEFFQSNTFEERLLAAQAMGYTNNEAMVALLGASLFEGDRRMRLYSAQSLSELGFESIIKPLQTSLTREKDKEITLAVIEALGSVNTKEAARILRMQTTKSDPKVREQVVRSYMRQGNPDNAKALELLLRDRDEGVRWLAFLATLALDEKKGTDLFSSSLRSPPSSWLADLSMLSDARKHLVIEHLVTHSSSSVRSAALGYAIKNSSEFEDTLKDLVLDPTYKESNRMAILAHMAERPSSKYTVIIERIAGSEEKSERLARMASWFLVRDTNNSMEATLRGMMLKKDPVLKALAIYGLMTKKS